MLFQDLLRKIDVNKVFDKFLPLALGTEIPDSYNTEKFANFKDLFMTRYKDFTSRDVTENTEGYLICIRYLELFPEYVDGTLKEEFDYSVSIIKPNKNYGFYSLTFTPWSQVLGTPVFDHSLERYGREFVAAAILDEMFEFGMYEEDKEETERKLKAQLDTAMKDVDEERYVPIEEAFKDFDMEEYHNSEEYKSRSEYTSRAIKQNAEIQDEFVARFKESLC